MLSKGDCRALVRILKKEYKTTKPKTTAGQKNKLNNLILKKIVESFTNLDFMR